MFIKKLPDGNPSKELSLACEERNFQKSKAKNKMYRTPIYTHNIHIYVPVSPSPSGLEM
jgi:hypothetical protein